MVVSSFGHYSSGWALELFSRSFGPDPFDGVLGLGLDGETGGFYKTLIDQGLPSSSTPYTGEIMHTNMGTELFSFFLTHNNIPQAELTLGGIDDTKFSGNLTYTNAIFPGVWQLNSTGIFVNGKTNAILSPKKTLQPVISTGLANFDFPKSLAEVGYYVVDNDANPTDDRGIQAVYALISPDIKPFAAELGAYGIECSKIAGLQAVIDIGFKDQSGKPFNLTIPSSELSVGPFASNKSICQTFINAENNFDVEPDVPVLGGSLLKHYYSVWDSESGNGRIGFATPI
jgi:hypothetical protein